MATKSLGRVSIVPQGDYDENQVYKRLDLVKFDGKTYLSLKEDNTSLLADEDSWMLITESGRFEDLTPQELETILQPLNEATDAANQAAENALSGIKGVATQSNAPTAYVDGYLFERWVVNSPITSPNSWGNLTVSADELKDDFVFFNVTNGVVTKELSEKPIGIQESDFYIKNKFDKTKAVSGIIESNGTVSPNSTYVTSVIVPVEFGKSYYGSSAANRGVRRALFYIDGVFTVEGYYPEQTNSIVPPNPNINGVRISIFKNDLDTFQFEEGVARTEYSEHEILAIKGFNFVDKKGRELINGLSADLSNTVLKSDIKVTFGKNKFDKTKAVSGFIESNGTVSPNSTYVTSVIVPVEFGKSYYGSSAANRGVRRATWYINGVSTDVGYQNVTVNLLTPPNSNVNGVRFSIFAADQDTFQFEEGTARTGYSEYGIEIDEVYGIKVVRDDSNVDVSETTFSVFPKRMYSLVGKQFNLYYDAFNYLPEYGSGTANFLFEIDCNIGKSDVRSFNVIPNASQVGERDLTFKYLQSDGKVKEQLTTKLEVVSNNPFSISKNILLIGDSTWHNQTAPSLTLYQTFQEMGGAVINFLGKQRYPASSEARSGWGYDTFATGRKSWKITFDGVDPNINLDDLYTAVYSFGAGNYVRFCNEWVINPDGTGYAIGYDVITFTPPTTFPATFTKSAGGEFPTSLNVTGIELIESYNPLKNNNGVGNLDIDYYIANILKKPAGTKIDLVCFDLGINNAGTGVNPQNIVSHAKTLINAFAAHNSSIKIIVCIPKSMTSDNAYTSRKGYRLSIQQIRKALVDEFDFNSNFPNVFISQSAYGLDRFFGYPKATYSVANPGSRLDSAYQNLIVTNNDVHPLNEGAMQQADGLAGLIVKLLR